MITTIKSLAVIAAAIAGVSLIINAFVGEHQERFPWIVAGLFAIAIGYLLLEVQW